MYVSHLSLTNFRNYRYLELDLPGGLLVFSGGNAQGKSNLLEALYMLSIAKAYRASSDREAICRTATEDPGHAQVVGIVQRERDRVRIWWTCARRASRKTRSGLLTFAKT